MAITSKRAVSAGAVTTALGFTLSGTAGQTYTFPASSATLATLGANTFTALQTIAQAAANAGLLAGSGYSLTGSSTVSMSSYTGTLNTSGVVDLVKYAITDTAHGAGSNMLALYGGAAGATLKFSVDFNGSLTLGGQHVIGVGFQAIRFSDNSGGAAANGYIADSVGFNTRAANMYSWASSTDAADTRDTALARNAAGVVEVNNGTAGTFRDLKVRDIISNDATFFLRTATTLTNNAAAQVGTLTNGPAAGNPTKWIGIDDNGTTRYVPAW